MGELPDRVRRAFRDHDAFERVDETAFESTNTPFEGLVEVEPAASGRVEFRVTVRVPMLGEVTKERVADVVEEGWYETFALRVEDVAGVTRKEHDFDPTVSENGRRVEVEFAFEDIDERRGVDDAAALVDYVEGTFVQGIIPGYDYGEPVATILSRAQQSGGSDPVP
ncbi:DUF5813 family protein [Halegenticoccus tardaugens]|uniref:DUF5813 family protein n=1 Tax=Halegenticoccus tardaugens TaxID=2071624 RepID=UPI00100A9D59|nr:DUF5813 family protein [Halegenticoccus tardaugens]